MIRAFPLNKLATVIAETLHCHYFLVSALIKPSVFGLPQPVAKSYPRRKAVIAAGDVVEIGVIA